ncbi:hypothetical protein ATANTOWER_026699 [Ataeniobius toweri]|uniref:Uncharacterized protein n=1 Tax=Ataeniobius toweri TaxID=208326 RepID=A0ABU7A855_9TELE|nr:hypothetical protein [Ataeniobius toweri]
MDLSVVRRASILLLNIYAILLPVTQLLLPLNPVVPGSSFSFQQSSGTQASSSSSTPVLPQSSLLRSFRSWTLSSAQTIIHYSASSEVRFHLCHVSTSLSPLCRRSTRSLAPPTVITITTLISARL